MKEQFFAEIILLPLFVNLCWSVNLCQLLSSLDVSSYIYNNWGKFKHSYIKVLYFVKQYGLTQMLKTFIKNIFKKMYKLINFLI